jgi:hypothetical protein
MSFEYEGFTLDIEQGQDNGTPIFSVWANHDWGCAVAVTGVFSRSEAVYKAKQWVKDKERVQNPVLSKQSPKSQDSLNRS